MTSELNFPLECPECGNFQYFKEVRALVHEVPFAATHGELEYGEPENASAPVVLKILCGYCNAVVHDNEVTEPLVRNPHRYKDAATIFRDVKE